LVFIPPLFVFVLALWVGIFAGDVRADATPFRFAVMADSHTYETDPAVNSKVLSQFIHDMNTLHPVFCLFPGDLVFSDMVGNDAFKRQLQEWVGARSAFQGTLYVTPGNDDIKHVPGRDDTWREVFAKMPGNGPSGVQYKCSYYFDYGNSRFISILSDWEDGRREVDQAWLDQILDASGGFDHIFVFSHHPIRDLGSVEGAFWKSLVRHHVDVYFCGHWHYYNRMQPGNDGPWQVIVGTAGAPQYAPAPSVTGTTIPSQYDFATVDVDGPTVKVTFYGDTDGDGHYNNVMDTFFIAVPKGGEQRVPSGGVVGQSAATVEKRGCRMPGF
jgi:Calcineurin-like phosphoesterase